MKTVVLAVLAAAALAAPAAASSPYLTERAMLSTFKAHGVTFRDGSHLPVIDGFCNGSGPSRGPIANPAFRRFDCELVTGTLDLSSSNPWYEVDVRLNSSGRPVVRVVGRS